VAEKEREIKTSSVGEAAPSITEEPWWSSAKAYGTWFETAPDDEFETDTSFLHSPVRQLMAGRDRLDRIKESYGLLKQFTVTELRILLALKRNGSPKGWTLREDLLVLTSTRTSREVAEALQARNKEAVKKRLQLLRSKGLLRRQSDGDGAGELPTETPV
jgi:DNA-binding MarR family transcriptional regulator